MSNIFVWIGTHLLIASWPARLISLSTSTLHSTVVVGIVDLLIIVVVVVDHLHVLVIVVVAAASTSMNQTRSTAVIDGCR